MNFTVYASLLEDINTGWVWLSNASFPPRCIIKITNPVARRSVYCEALQMDANFLAHYNQSPRLHISDCASAIVMNEWYRAKLGSLNTQSVCRLDVEQANNVCGQLRACLQHPQIVVRLATWLAIMSLVLGAIGVVLGVISLWPRT
jgi:hypothetical protein